mmetsp:Transcript_5972/g.8929  ORF Transcript_5972/g.8929 Transcript_5972/m.8929 type:complete len:309 (+) Transcript_5972:1064-1990(+)
MKETKKKLSKLRFERKALEAKEKTQKADAENLRLKLKSGNLKNFNRKNVRMLLQKIDLYAFYDFFCKTGIVDRKGAHLDQVNDGFFQWEEKKFPLGLRKRIIFHLKYIEREKKLFEPKQSDPLLSWKEERVCQWLKDVSCDEFKIYFESLKICEIALASMREDELQGEIAKLVEQVNKAQWVKSGKKGGEKGKSKQTRTEVRKRRELQKKISDLWTNKITKLRQNQNIPSKSKDDNKICSESKDDNKIRSESKKGESENDDCAVCLCPMHTQKTTKLKCGHEFHTECINKWKENGKDTCILCRSKIQE